MLPFLPSSVMRLQSNGFDDALMLHTGHFLCNPARAQGNIGGVLVHYESRFLNMDWHLTRCVLCANDAGFFTHSSAC